ALIRQGFIGCTPESPQIAVDLHTLEVYHRLRRRQPQLGIQPFARMLCDISNINYSSHTRDAFSQSFDAYLHILRTIHSRLDSELGRDTPNWRSLHSCPCCHAKLPDDPPLVPAVQFASDGNNSARRVESAGNADPRTFTSDYFIPRKEVDVYKNEVRSTGDDTADNDAADNDNEGQSGRCTSDFRASRPDGHKTALDIYETTGIFASACQHGIIQKICEMVRSGELAKYGLATVAHLLDVHGNDVGLGQDTGCAFSKTVASSPLLGDKARAQNLQICVNAFHGYAHSRLCQLSFHPLYRRGAGLSDLEQMERVFSGSNPVARIVRYASQFHFIQGLDLHFQQWDEDRYADLTTFLISKYRQATAMIAEYDPVVRAMCNRLSITTADIDKWPELERTFLLNLKEEPDERKLAAEYVRAIEARERLGEELSKTSGAFRLATGSVDYDKDVSETLKIENSRRATANEFFVQNRAVHDLETALGISKTWLQSSDEYQAAARYIKHQDFYRASDRLQLLVVQRLQELAKTHAMDTAYKMRMSISKAVERRSTAVRTALANYNKLAATMDPPAVKLTWREIIDYSFSSELDILKHSFFQPDVRDQPWAKPVNRDIATKYFKTVRAREEINRLNVEARRLHAWIIKENTDLENHRKRLEQTNPLLAVALTHRYSARIRINKVHLSRLVVLERLRGYTGARLSDTAESVCAPSVETAASQDGGISGMEPDLEDDELLDSMHRLSTFFEQLE
ncbi:hypothetical protein CONPUDRAFT_51967, partial [Coniophora puteana RWD-64-598 SS2]